MLDQNKFFSFIITFLYISNPPLELENRKRTRNVLWQEDFTNTFSFQILPGCSWGVFEGNSSSYLVRPYTRIRRK